MIGVIYNQAERTISYTKNGLYLGVAFHNIHEDRLFPTVRPRLLFGRGHKKCSTAFHSLQIALAPALEMKEVYLDLEYVELMT